MNTLIRPILDFKKFKKLLHNINNNNTPFLVTGIVDVQKAHIIECLRQVYSNIPTLIITYDELRAKEIYEDIKFFENNCIYYPSRDILFYNADFRSNDIEKQRICAINEILNSDKPIVVLSIKALFDKLISKEEFSKHIISIREGSVINVDEFIKELIFMGYERCDITENQGNFSVRGGIIDIFLPIKLNPYRIEFWGDEIESIRIIDVNSQRSINKVESIEIFPAREIIYREEELEKGLSKVIKEMEYCIKKYEKKGNFDEAERLFRHINEDIEKFKEYKLYSNVINYINYFFDNLVNLIDYMPDDTILYYDEPQRIFEYSKNFYLEYIESIKNRIDSGYFLPGQLQTIFDYNEILNFSKKKKEILFTSVSVNIKNFYLKDIINISGKSTLFFGNKIDLFCEEILKLKNLNYSIIIFAGSSVKCERFIKEMKERNIECYYTENNDKEIKKGSVVVMKGKLSRGFEYSEIKFAVFCESEIFYKLSDKRIRKKNKKVSYIDNFIDLEIGDYVVHENYGIGIYRGLEKVVIDGISKDYLKISYLDNGSIFVPVNQMNIIQKYIGNNGISPKISKLGSNDWTKAKNKVSEAVKILAKDLVDLYAKRKSSKGYVYSYDTIWQKEFEESFPYEETYDQIIAIEEVKRDMESEKVMDRLICGDVGYGKTEIAIRAAFKAVQDNKQVVYLVPTTILAQQHYNTFCSRMADYPVRIDLLSRFRNINQQKKTIIDIGKGMVDIVIGTHRILSKDVKFKDLGLIIVDEEQRFGVSHKEKLKSMKKNVDVLTLTATPIPRTLHMSLSGIRDMSILEEPPQERKPIQTYVMEYNSEFIRDAINREISRGGQVYYINNRINNIESVTINIQNIVPYANISYIHGQMNEREIENIMNDFINGNIDVLVCTTIIETGLDISNVNTIIIQDADYMGLSQLYQLKGRVGRGNKIAYAYLMYRKDKILNEFAEKRLKTIKEFTELGSGFKIAMRDLEIRGAGNLLGAEQHGHMESVGYDMYCKLLDDAVKNIKGECIIKDFKTNVDININAFIPDFYINDEKQRLEMYKKISFIDSKDDYYDIIDEIEDRYGNIPKATQTLIEIAFIKSEANKKGIIEILEKNSEVSIIFQKNDNFNFKKILNFITENNIYSFIAGDNPTIKIKLNNKKDNSVLIYIKNLLQEI